jgi:hypothetical protein
MFKKLELEKKRKCVKIISIIILILGIAILIVSWWLNVDYIDITIAIVQFITFIVMFFSVLSVTFDNENTINQMKTQSDLMKMQMKPVLTLYLERDKNKKKINRIDKSKEKIKETSIPLLMKNIGGCSAINIHLELIGEGTPLVSTDIAPLGNNDIQNLGVYYTERDRVEKTTVFGETKFIGDPYPHHWPEYIKITCDSILNEKHIFTYKMKLGGILISISEDQYPKNTHAKNKLEIIPKI